MAGVKEDATRTRYVVLWFVETGWEVVSTGYEATSADTAIRAIADKRYGGTYVAVPARSWKPMRVEQVQTVQTVITAAEDVAETASTNVPPTATVSSEDS